jgi:RES domain-containing protein
LSEALDAAFPAHVWKPGRRLARIHKAGRSPWWFSSDGSGRFDPVGVGGMGTCSLAENELGAFVEVFRTATTLDVKDVEARRVSLLALDRELRLANVCSRKALRHGVTAVLGASGDYGASQRFASAALEAGFDGVRWWLRHGPAQRLAGVALFGPAGTPDDADRWPVPEPRELSRRLLERARRGFGYRVVPRP